MRALKVIGGIIGSIVLLAVLIIASLYIGFGIDMFQANADREVFKKSTTYVEESASFLAKEYKEYNEAKGSEKNAIAQYVILRYPNLEISKISNETLAEFYQECLER